MTALCFRNDESGAGDCDRAIADACRCASAREEKVAMAKFNAAVFDKTPNYDPKYDDAV